MRRITVLFLAVLMVLSTLSVCYGWERFHDRHNHSDWRYNDRHHGYNFGRTFERAFAESLGYAAGDLVYGMVRGSFYSGGYPYGYYPPQPATCYCSEPRELASWAKDPSGEWQLEKRIVNCKFPCPCR